MKLLPKQQLNVQIAAQRKVQIDEGVTLAKKIDALRETLTNLQVQHSAFLNGMEGELHNRTNGLIEKIAEYERDIIELEERRKKLLEPLENEWKTVNAKSAEIDQIKANLDKNTLKTAQKEEKLTLLGTEIKTRLSRIKVRERELDRVYEKAEESNAEIERVRQDILSKKDIQDKHFEEVDKELSRRESDIESQQFTINNQKEHLEMEQEEITNEKKRLADMRGTLERAMNRLQKNG